MERSDPRPGDGGVVLRDVVEADLPVFFEHQRDPEAVRVAAFSARERDAFDAHWARILATAGVLVKTVVHEGRVAGNVVGFARDGHRQIGYWIGRPFWRRGIATRAVAAFLEIETTRPIFGHVARHNVGSIRVLEKNGFVVCGEARAADGDGGEVVEEWIMKLGPDA